MIKKISKSLDQIMNSKFLTKWFISWGIGVNILIVIWLLSKVIRIVASL